MMRRLIFSLVLGAAAPMVAAAQQHDGRPSWSGHGVVTFEMVHVDGGMAMVWAPYDFHLGTKFSHCGVDNFQFARTAEGWKIIALVDTRQRTGCPGH